MNTSTDSTPLITSKLSASQKGFSPLFIILGIILVIGIVGGAYYLGKAQNPKPQPQNPVITSQTPKPTDQIVNWKKFNSQYFSFSYPNQWQVSVDQNGHPGFLLLVASTVSDQSFFTVSAQDGRADDLIQQLKSDFSRQRIKNYSRR